MATTRRKSKAAPVRRKSTTRRKVTPTRKVAPKTLATLDAGDLQLINKVFGLMELKRIEMNALDTHFHEMTKQIKEKYEVSGNITIDFTTGKITKAVDRSGE